MKSKRAIVLLAVLLLAAANLKAQDLPRLAVVEFSTNNSNKKTKQDAVAVRNLVESRMIAARKYRIITNDEIDKLLANQKIQVSDISSAENIKKLRLQNIRYLVTGSVDALGMDYAVTVKLLDLSIGRFSHSDNDFMGGSSEELYTGISSLITKFIAGMSSQEPRGKTGKYKIGDRGPGGGLVFYVEDNGGMEVSRTLGEYIWDEAVRAAEQYDGGGFNDWRLPAKDELNLIYLNLRESGMAKLAAGDPWYWSSSGYDDSSAWEQHLGDGRQFGANKKHTTSSVRAVRNF